jgi:hypothetical protein
MPRPALGAEAGDAGLRIGEVEQLLWEDLHVRARRFTMIHVSRGGSSSVAKDVYGPPIAGDSVNESERVAVQVHRYKAIDAESGKAEMRETKSVLGHTFGAKLLARLQ